MGAHAMPAARPPPAIATTCRVVCTRRTLPCCAPPLWGPASCASSLDAASHVCRGPHPAAALGKVGQTTAPVWANAAGVERALHNSRAENGSGRGNGGGCDGGDDGKLGGTRQVERGRRAAQSREVPQEAPPKPPDDAGVLQNVQSDQQEHQLQQQPTVWDLQRPRRRSGQGPSTGLALPLLQSSLSADDLAQLQKPRAQQQEYKQQQRQQQQNQHQSQQQRQQQQQQQQQRQRGEQQLLQQPQLHHQQQQPRRHAAVEKGDLQLPGGPQWSAFRRHVFPAGANPALPTMRAVVIVEGSMDKEAVSKAVNAAVYACEGTRVLRGHARPELVALAALGRPLVVLTDPDERGRSLRAHLEAELVPLLAARDPPGRLLHAFVPEASAVAAADGPIKQAGNRGIEHAVPGVLQAALRAAAPSFPPDRRVWDLQRLQELRLARPFNSGGAASPAGADAQPRERRRRLCASLGLGKCSGSQLVAALNRYFAEERVLAALAALNAPGSG